MNRKVTVSLLSMLMAAWSGAARAFADPPEDQVVQLTYHSDPQNSESPVSFTVKLFLTPADADGDAVGWQITSAGFHDPILRRDWVETDVIVSGASDGLWWIEHADPSQPTDVEFTSLPSIFGTAESQTAGVNDLKFALAPGSTPPSGTIARSTHEFAVDGEEEDPEEEGDDEPVVVDNDPLDA